MMLSGILLLVMCLASGSGGMDECMRQVSDAMTLQALETEEPWDEAYLHVTTNGKVYVMARREASSSPRALVYKLHVCESESWKLYSEIRQESVQVVGTDAAYYIASYETLGQNRGASGPWELKIGRFCGSLPVDNPVLTVPLSPPLGSGPRQVGRALGADIVPIDMARGDLCLVGYSHDLVPDPLAFLGLLLSAGHSGAANRLHSISIKGGQVQSTQARPGPIKSNQDDYRPKWVLQGKLLHLIWRRPLGCYYATIDVETNTWTPEIALEDKQEVMDKHIALYGQAVYCAWSLKDDQGIRLATISGNKVHHLGKVEVGSMPRLVQSGDRLFLIWCRDETLFYKTYDGKEWSASGRISGSEAVGGRRPCLEVGTDKSGTIHLVYTTMIKSGLSDASSGADPMAKYKYRFGKEIIYRTLVPTGD